MFRPAHRGYRFSTLLATPTQVTTTELRMNKKLKIITKRLRRVLAPYHFVCQAPVSQQRPWLMDENLPQLQHEEKE